MAKKNTLKAVAGKRRPYAFGMEGEPMLQSTGQGIGRGVRGGRKPGHRGRGNRGYR